MVTPPPGKDQTRQQSTPPISSAIETEAKVRSLLEAMLREDPQHHPHAARAHAQLMKIAVKRGTYIIASEIRHVLGNIPIQSKDGVTCNNARGYTLAGELFLHHLRQEISSIEQERHPAAPNIFRAFCDEAIDSLFASENPRKGVEMLLDLVDDLLLKAIRDSSRARVYFGLTQQILASLVELSYQKLDKDTVELHHIAQLQRRGNTPAPESSTAPPVIDKQIIHYLVELQLRIKQIEEGFLRYGAHPEYFGGGLNQDRDQAKARECIRYLRGLLRIADQSGYLGLSASLKEQIGTALNTLETGMGAQFLSAAAEDFRAQGAIEHELRFEKLSKKRYSKANALYKLLGNVTKTAQGCVHNEA